MGGQIKVAHSLGEGRPEEASRYVQGAIQMGVLFGILYAFIMIVRAKPLIGFFGLSDSVIIKDAEIYLKIACGGIIFFISFIVVSRRFTEDI